MLFECASESWGKKHTPCKAGIILNCAAAIKDLHYHFYIYILDVISSYCAF